MKEDKQTMHRTNTIGIVGTIKAKPERIAEASDWRSDVYETTLSRTRPSGKEDTYILQFDGRSAGTTEMLQRIVEGAEVLIGGEIRSENIWNPQPEENRVKMYIYAEVITVNDPPADSQNEVEIYGNVCKEPHSKVTRPWTKGGKQVVTTTVMVAVNSRSGANYIPCVCFGQQAFKAAELEIGDSVRICGRFRSRIYKKKITGRKLPFLATAYEVCALDIKRAGAKGKETKTGKKGEADA